MDAQLIAGTFDLAPELLAAHHRDISDVLTVLLLHVWHHCARTTDSAEELEVEILHTDLVGNGFEVLGIRSTGIVNEDFRAVKAFYCLGDETLAIF